MAQKERDTLILGKKRCSLIINYSIWHESNMLEFGNFEGQAKNLNMPLKQLLLPRGARGEENEPISGCHLGKDFKFFLVEKK